MKIEKTMQHEICKKSICWNLTTTFFLLHWFILKRIKTQCLYNKEINYNFVVMRSVESNRQNLSFYSKADYVQRCS